MKIIKIRRLGLILAVCVLDLLPVFAFSAVERRTALVIGNGSYEVGRLKNPVHDASALAAALTDLGFEVILKKNAGHREMEEAVDDFGNRLKRGGVGLFYYAGHGIQVSGVNYLIPIDANIKKESDIKYLALDSNKILDEMANANNGLNIVIFDACRDNPFARSFRSASRGLAIVSSAPSGTFISYSTGPGQVAQDGDGLNSPYTAALLSAIKEPGIVIEEVFKRVRQKLRKETGQVPWELSSLEGAFYFNPAGAAIRETPAPELGLGRGEPSQKKGLAPNENVITKAPEIKKLVQSMPDGDKRESQKTSKQQNNQVNVASYSRTSWTTGDVKFNLSDNSGRWKLMVSATGSSDEGNAISRKVFAKKDAERKAKTELHNSLANHPFNFTDSLILRLFDERDNKDLQYQKDGKIVVIKFEIMLPEKI